MKRTHFTVSLFVLALVLSIFARVIAQPIGPNPSGFTVVTTSGNGTSPFSFSGGAIGKVPGIAVIGVHYSTATPFTCPTIVPPSNAFTIQSIQGDQPNVADGHNDLITMTVSAPANSVNVVQQTALLTVSGTANYNNSGVPYQVVQYTDATHWGVLQPNGPGSVPSAIETAGTASIGAPIVETANSPTQMLNNGVWCMHTFTNPIGYNLGPFTWTGAGDDTEGMYVQVANAAYDPSVVGHATIVDAVAAPIPMATSTSLITLPQYTTTAYADQTVFPIFAGCTNNPQIGWLYNISDYSMGVVFPSGIDELNQYLRLQQPGSFTQIQAHALATPQALPTGTLFLDATSGMSTHGMAWVSSSANNAFPDQTTLVHYIGLNGGSHVLTGVTGGNTGTLPAGTRVLQIGGDMAGRWGIIDQFGQFPGLIGGGTVTSTNTCQFWTAGISLYDANVPQNHNVGIGAHPPGVGRFRMVGSQVYTTSTIPAASGNNNILENQSVCVTDATKCSWNTIYTGGGTVKCLLTSDNTNWRETGQPCF